MIHLFKSKIYISIFVPFFLAVIALSPDAVFFYIALCGAFCHELAHIYALIRSGGKIEKISVYPCGADMRADSSELSVRQEIIIALSGPLANALLCIPSLAFVLSGAGIYVLAFFVSNLVLFLVNIFPVRGLDGGRVLFALLLMRCDIEKAYRMFDVISTVAFGVLCAFSLSLLYFTGYNLSLVLVCIYIYISEYARQKMCTGGILV